MFGGGGMNPRKMQQMMEQMGIDFDDLEAEEVVITLADGEQLVFGDPEVTRMEAQGQQTYQVVGEPESRAAGEGESDDASDEGGAGSSAVDEADVDIVAQRTGVSREQAREALAANDGDLAAAVADLE